MALKVKVAELEDRKRMLKSHIQRIKTATTSKQRRARGGAVPGSPSVVARLRREIGVLRTLMAQERDEIAKLLDGDRSWEQRERKIQIPLWWEERERLAATLSECEHRRAELGRMKVGYDDKLDVRGAQREIDELCDRILLVRKGELMSSFGRLWRDAQAGRVSEEDLAARLQWEIDETEREVKRLKMEREAIEANEAEAVAYLDGIIAPLVGTIATRIQQLKGGER